MFCLYIDIFFKLTAVNKWNFSIKCGKCSTCSTRQAKFEIITMHAFRNKIIFNKFLTKRSCQMSNPMLENDFSKAKIKHRTILSSGILIYLIFEAKLWTTHRSTRSVNFFFRMFKKKRWRSFSFPIQGWVFSGCLTLLQHAIIWILRKFKMCYRKIV